MTTKTSPLFIPRNETLKRIQVDSCHVVIVMRKAALSLTSSNSQYPSQVHDEVRLLEIRWVNFG